MIAEPAQSPVVVASTVAPAIAAEKQKSLGQISTERKALSPEARKADYYRLPQTQQNWLRHEQFLKVLESQHFQSACIRAGVQPTLRQASKWTRKFGAAWTEHTR